MIKKLSYELTISDLNLERDEYEKFHNCLKDILEEYLNNWSQEEAEVKLDLVSFISERIWL